MVLLLIWAAVFALVFSGYWWGRYVGRREDLLRRADGLYRPADTAQVRRGIAGWFLTTAGQWGDSLGSVVARLQLPGYAERLHRAGHPLSQREFFGLKALCGLPVFLLGVLLNAMGFLGSTTLMIFIVGAYLAPDLWVWLQIGNRRQRLAASLPDVLDTLAITLQAGSGLAPALEVVADRAQGPMGEELRRTVEEIRLGRPLEQALEALLNRTGARDLEPVVQALKQGRQLGVPISTIVSVEAKSLRRHRILSVREMAAKAGPKISMVATVCNAGAILWFIAAMMLLNFRYNPEIFGLGGFSFGQ